jgi:hypothetical protein
MDLYDSGIDSPTTYPGTDHFRYIHLLQIAIPGLKNYEEEYSYFFIFFKVPFTGYCAK